MADENVHKLNGEELLSVAGGSAGNLEIGERAQIGICPFCMVPLVQGSITRPNWIEYNSTTGKMVQRYQIGIKCPQCSYNVEGPWEMPWFERTATGLRPVEP